AALRHTDLAVFGPAASAAATEVWVRVGPAVFVGAESVEVGGFARQKAAFVGLVLERPADLRVASDALSLGRAAIVVGLAQVRAVTAIDLVEALDRPGQRSRIEVGVAVGRRVAGLAHQLRRVVVAGNGEDEKNSEQREGRPGRAT